MYILNKYGDDGQIIVMHVNEQIILDNEIAVNTTAQKQRMVVVAEPNMEDDNMYTVFTANKIGYTGKTTYYAQNGVTMDITAGETHKYFFFVLP